MLRPLVPDQLAVVRPALHVRRRRGDSPKAARPGCLPVDSDEAFRLG
jgi:hypothetical protein